MDKAWGTACLDEMRSRGAGGWTAVMIATTRRDMVHLNQLLRAGANPNASNQVTNR